jgi:hypothetical protein
MSVTAVADVIVPSLFAKYSQERTATAWALIQAGIVVRSPEFDSKASSGGKVQTMPFFQDLSGNSEATPGDGTTSLTPAKITSASDASAVHYRSKAWSTNDLAGAMSSSDPLGAITSLVGDYWAREYQRLLLASMKGVFLASSMSGKILSYFNADVSANGLKELDDQVVIDALGLMGDASQKVTAMAVHSAVRNGLWKKGLIEIVKGTTPAEDEQYFLGRRLVIDDGMPKVAVTGGYKYTSYLFGQGAFAYGEGTPANAVEMDREILKRNSVLANDKQFVLHPRGVKWTSANHAGDTPSDAELETGTSWASAFELKNIRLGAVVTNG